MDDATRKRLARCLNYHDGGSPTHEDVQALWRAYTEAEAARVQLEETLADTVDILTEERERAMLAAECARQVDILDHVQESR